MQFCYRYKRPLRRISVHTQKGVYSFSRAAAKNTIVVQEQGACIGVFTAAAYKAFFTVFTSSSDWDP